MMKKLFKKGYMGLMILMMTIGLVGCTSSESSIELTISAAASLKEAMEEIEKEYAKLKPEVILTFNFGASGSLQKQIEEGAPCDLFISAGQKQMKALQEGGLLQEDTIKSVVKNELVLIAPKDSTLTAIGDITTEKVTHLAVGEPSSVPAGKYAQEVFETLGITGSVEPKIVMAKDVKEVFAWVQTGNADAGFVYKSDTVDQEGIQIVETTDEASHSPIIYPMGVPKGSKLQEEAIAFENFLLTEEAQRIFKEKGYAPVPKP